MIKAFGVAALCGALLCGCTTRTPTVNPAAVSTAPDIQTVSDSVLYAADGFSIGFPTSPEQTATDTAIGRATATVTTYVWHLSDSDYIVFDIASAAQVNPSSFVARYLMGRGFTSDLDKRPLAVPGGPAVTFAGKGPHGRTLAGLTIAKTGHTYVVFGYGASRAALPQERALVNTFTLT